MEKIHANCGENMWYYAWNFWILIVIVKYVLAIIGPIWILFINGWDKMLFELKKCAQSANENLLNLAWSLYYNSAAKSHHIHLFTWWSRRGEISWIKCYILFNCGLIPFIVLDIFLYYNSSHVRKSETHGKYLYILRFWNCYQG